VVVPFQAPWKGAATHRVGLDDGLAANCSFDFRPTSVLSENLNPRVLEAAAGQRTSLVNSKIRGTMLQNDITNQ
jgi:hypothetical protein